MAAIAVAAHVQYGRQDHRLPQPRHRPRASWLRLHLDRFVNQLIVETVGFVSILVFLIFAYFYSKAKNHDDAWIQLRRVVDVSTVLGDH